MKCIISLGLAAIHVSYESTSKDRTLNSFYFGCASCVLCAESHGFNLFGFSRTPHLLARIPKVYLTALYVAVVSALIFVRFFTVSSAFFRVLSLARAGLLVVSRSTVGIRASILTVATAGFLILFTNFVLRSYSGAGSFDEAGES